MARPLSPAEEREAEQTYRELVTKAPEPPPIFPAPIHKPEEATTMSEETDSKEAPKLSAKAGDQVRVVHRKTDGGWRLWETGTNKMIVRELFKSEQAAVKFAKEHGLDPVITGRKARVPKAKAPRKEKAKRSSKRQPATA